jgi:hypothetical protein
MIPGRWWYAVTYYGGNVDEVRAPGLIEAAQLAAEKGRVVRVEETYETHEESSPSRCGGSGEAEETASYFDGIAKDCENMAAEHDEAGNEGAREWHRGQADAYRDAAEKLRTDLETRS